MLLQIGLYYFVWILSAYYARNEKLSGKIFYFFAFLILLAQVFLTHMSIQNPLYFYAKTLLLLSVGISFDFLFTILGFWEWADTKTMRTKTIPSWLLILWMSFSISMQYLMISMNIDFAVFLSLGLMGGLGFPLTYFFAQRINVLIVKKSLRAYLYQGLFWAAVLPFILYPSAIKGLGLQ
jgi:hypothetical protein